MPDGDEAQLELLLIDMSQVARNAPYQAAFKPRLLCLMSIARAHQAAL